ncbi:hypothetical protein [Liquorilactobacillus nagelii]|jgi:hypothetical protein|uniref:hypothetical protein n=1 Tax=Liquorilactobacillus nagelii TaxID=82688 RepID=UPI0039E72D06
MIKKTCEGDFLEERNYQELLDKLVAGEIDEIKIEPKEFMSFQVALMNFRQRKRIVGIAHQQGIVYYHYNDNPTQ